MKLSKKGIENLKKREGYENYAYKDGNGNATFGVGHLILPSENYLLAYTKTKKAPDSLVNSILQNDIESRERKLSKLLGKAEVQVTQCQFDALFSFMFNIGEGAFEKSQLYINLKKNLQEKNYKIISEQFLSWNKPNLKTRRLSEISEFFSEEKNKIGFPLVLLGILTVLYISI